ncbi:hypothetical protein NUU61_007372 [Penicillium alfredii]|uniref:Phospholipase/carboxylesterase/thioesterase domain-containing protein n=1 Tax=Penicillium alfredii TaxID=1506179 RepID=A0A9W9F2P1_9EURO|nr:uncharacterized protein NUU61_007372 [Penicillium alfredii]KAJ5092502.1 hypothetical protein NUU61_007372 [Penicillium alfredii]
MEFPAFHDPQTPHTHTVILLHGRGSDGPEFSEELFESATSTGDNLKTRLPGWRWVFPTARDRWSTTFQEEMCAWFDAYSLDDIHAKQDLQVAGLRESVEQILQILDDEVKLLGGDYRRVYLGGISQGIATALWTFFGGVATGRIPEPLGGLLGFCGWLPFARQLEDLLQSSESPGTQSLRLVSGFFLDTIAKDKTTGFNELLSTSAVSTPVFLGHGADDEWVSVELGRQTSLALSRVMPHVEWSEFRGAEGDGHWIKEPEGFDQILKFLEKGAVS